MKITQLAIGLTSLLMVALSCKKTEDMGTGSPTLEPPIVVNDGAKVAATIKWYRT